MISFPIVPAAPGLTGAPAAPAGLPSVARSANVGAFDFVDLLKQMTANVAAPVDVIAPADVDADAPQAAPGKAAGQKSAAPLDPTAAAPEKSDQKDADPTVLAMMIAAPIAVVPPSAQKRSAEASRSDDTGSASLQASASAPLTKAAVVLHDPVVGPTFTSGVQEPPAKSELQTPASMSDPLPVAVQKPIATPVRDAATPAPVSANVTVPGVAQAALQDATSSKGDSNSSSQNSSRQEPRALDAVAPRAAAPAPATNASAFQLVATPDVRSLLVNTSAPATLSTATASTLTARDTAELPQQIVQAMRMQWNNGVGDARITLRPEYLGDVTISIRVDRGDVAATLQASQPEVRQWIESHESTLRQMLSDRGLRLDELAVTDVPEERQAADENNQRRDAQEQQQQPKRRAAATATFEVMA